MDFILQPWPWYVSGPLITLTMFLLLKSGGKFGVSSTLRDVCSISGAGKFSSFFDYDWKKNSWNLVFAVGALIGGFIAMNFLSDGSGVAISVATIQDLSDLGIVHDNGMAPEGIFNWENVFSSQGIIIMILGGFLIGFGTRWAGGCTSGHAISGLSNLQLPSLIAVIGFFIGGLVMTHLLFPLIFSV